MKYFITVFLLLTTAFTAKAQTYEIGGMVGAANYIGDIGKTNYINPSTLAVGGIFKWNRSARHAFRASFLFANIAGDDTQSENNRRAERGYNFKNRIKELSIGLEYTFWEFDVHSLETISTPYLYTGITAFGYSALYKDSNNLISKYDNAINFGIPMVVGYKVRVSTNALVGFEVGARYTFTDNLDGSNPGKGKADDLALKFGNIDSNDWYVFTGITVTFAFGRRPCYCVF